jgi:hypothetical protein
MEEVMYGPFPSIISLFANVVFLLALLVTLNSALKRLAPRLAFSQNELLTLYIILTISTGMAGQSGLNIVCGMIAHGAWFARPENGWTGYLEHFPDWLVIKDKAIVREHFLGNSTFYRAEVLKAWCIPILAWTVLFCLILWVAYCVNILVRRRWADQERLTFPIVWLPLQMTDEGPKATFFRNRLMWAGFIIAGGLNLWNGIAFLYPSLPMLPIGIIDLKPYFTTKPWSAIDWTPTTLYPLIIGISYLLPLDLLFSCWFFYFYWKAQRILGNVMAWDAVPDFPFTNEQGFGATMALFGYYVWSGRTHYAEILRNAWAGKSDSGEALPERQALVGIGIGLLGLLLFCLMAKVTLWLIFAFFAIYLPMLIVVTRIRAELGSPVHDFTFMGPDFMLPRLTGAEVLSKSDLAFLSLSYPITYCRSNDTMPIALESMQMGRQKALPTRPLFCLLLLATVWGTLTTFWAYEHQAYSLGTAAKFNAGTHFAQESFDKLGGWMSGGRDPKPNSPASLAMGSGFATTLILFWFRMRFFGFPLHPIGYVVSAGWGLNITWLPMIIAWIFKGLALRYGGLKLYRTWIPFFLGLILGDCIMGSIWGILSLLLNTRTYNFFGA